MIKRVCVIFKYPVIINPLSGCKVYIICVYFFVYLYNFEYILGIMSRYEYIIIL